MTENHTDQTGVAGWTPARPAGPKTYRYGIRTDLSDVPRTFVTLLSPQVFRDAVERGRPVDGRFLSEADPVVLNTRSVAAYCLD